MEKTLAFILVILLYTCSYGQETYYTSGLGSGHWNDPQSWMIGETGTLANEIPTSESHVVIRHSLTHYVQSSYSHKGKIEVRKGSTYELSGDGEYAYTGDLFELKGTLIAGTNFSHKSDSEMKSNLVIRNTGLVYALSNLFIDKGSEILIEQNACGSIYVFGTLEVHGGDSRMLGQARIISESVRVWGTDGVEIVGENEWISHISLLLGNNIQIFSSEEQCEAGNSIVSGKGGHTPDIDLSDFRASIKELSVEVRWETNSLASLPDFKLERAWEGDDFSVLKSISSLEINETAGAYQLEDSENPEQKRRYRLSYVNELGESVILGVLEAGAGPVFEAYPNPFHGESLSIRMLGFSAEQGLSIQILDLHGKKIWEAKTKSNMEGNANYLAQPKLNPGTYMVFIESMDVRKSQRLVVL